MSEKMGVSLQDWLLRLTCTDAMEVVSLVLRLRKRGVVGVVEGVTLVRPQ